MGQAQTLSSIGWPGRDWRLTLADTVVVVRDEEVDLLSEEAQLVRWFETERERLGPICPEEVPALEDLHELRAAIRALLFAAARGNGLPDDSVAVVNRYSAAASWYRQIDASDPDRPCLTYGGVSDNRADQLLAAIADSAIDLLTGSDRGRIRICSAPSCGMFFLMGKRGQQWCSVSCGNRARVARHYERSRNQER